MIEFWEGPPKSENFWTRWDNFWSRHWKLRNLGRSLAAFFEGKIERGYWFAWCLHGIWYRETTRGTGWALIWWGEGLVIFKRIPDGGEPPTYHTAGPFPLLPAKQWGPIRFYRLGALRDEEV